MGFSAKPVRDGLTWGLKIVGLSFIIRAEKATKKIRNFESSQNESCPVKYKMQFHGPIPSGVIARPLEYEQGSTGQAHSTGRGKRKIKSKE